MIHVEQKSISTMLVNKKPNDSILPENAAYADMRLCFVLRGSAVWQINEKQHTVQKGNIIFLNSRLKRRFIRYGADGFSLVAFTLARQSFASARHLSFFLTCIKDRDGIFHSEALLNLLAEAYIELNQSPAPDYALVSALLTTFFIKAERMLHYDPDSAVKMDKVMLQTLDYIDAHITEKINLTELATMAGFTESSFSRWFTKQNGVSFKKYVMIKKIEHAIHLLETTDRKVIDIAFECGFDSISGFYDTFRKVTGTTPSKFTYIV